MSTPSRRPPFLHAIKSLLISGPPRFRFCPTSRPLHFACSIIRSRRNCMFRLRVSRLTLAARWDRYFASIHSAMSVPLLLLHEPGFPGAGDGLGLGDGDGEGDGDGAGGGGAGGSGVL